MCLYTNYANQPFPSHQIEYLLQQWFISKDQEIPKIMKNADYSSDLRKIIDFDEYKVPFKLKEYKHLIKVH